MAARVLWLVGTGQVAPGEVLGLTFTNKAAAELGGRVRQSLRAAGLLGGPRGPAEAPAAGSTDASAAAAETDEPSVLTYHAYAGRLLREHGLRIGVEPGARLLADATRFQLAVRVLSRYDGPLSAVSHSLPVVVDYVLALDAELAEHLVPTDAVRTHDRAVVAEADAWLAEQVGATKTAFEPTRVMRATAVRRLELLDLVNALRRERRRADTLDFSDQMRLAAELVRSCPPVAEQQRGAYRVVLLDEYQDTSVAQRVLLQHLFGDGHPVTAVGDPCQAIYGWRGASVRNIDEFPVDFPCADGSPARRLALSVNNRSDQTVLDLANVLSEPLREIHPGVAPLRPRPDRRDSGRVATAVHATHAEEVAWVADEIAQLVHREAVPAEQVAVLLRASVEAVGLRDALLDRDVPVNVVGLGGLLDVPEVADVVATLDVLDDPTANPSLVRLLAGPRWRIGVRDLALLGRRAAQLAGGTARRPEAVEATEGAATGPEATPAETREAGAGEPGGEARLSAALADAVAGVDPVEVVSLVNAVEDPGPLPFSPEARERFAAFAAELRALRRYHGEPAAELIGQIVARSGIGVEVAALPHGDGGAALAQLAEIAAQFSDVNGGTGVRAFLAYTRAARRFDRGLEPPADATVGGVKLLTAHKAKGLEFAVVFVPTLSERVFPSEQVRPSWTRSAFTVPAALRGDADDRPVLGGLERDDHDALKEADRVQAELEERRLVYVAATRAEHMLILSGHWWGPHQVKARGPSSYLRAAVAFCRARTDGRAVVLVDEAAPAAGASNPAVQDGIAHPWPAPLDPEALARRREVARAVRTARAGRAAASAAATAEPAAISALTAEERAVVASWDRDLEVLVEEARGLLVPERSVRLPSALSATTSLRLMSDPPGLAADLARPMPRPPAPAANRGTRFHAWVESHFRTRQLDLADLLAPAPRAAAPARVLDLDDPAASGDGIDVSRAPVDLLGDVAAAVGEDDLAELRRAFLAGPFADRAPEAVEAPFGITLGGLVVRGRIDAVYREPDGRYLVVDWKTGRRAPEAGQLAIYRIAWAELRGVDPEQVRAVFYTVPTGEVHEPPDLPDRAALTAMLAPPTPPAPHAAG